MNKIKKALLILVILIIVDILPIIYLAVELSYSEKLYITILNPLPNQVYVNSPILVNGTVSMPSTNLYINNIPIKASRNGYYETCIDIINGNNVIIIRAINNSQNITKTITIKGIL